jgi:protein SCO1/2
MQTVRGADHFETGETDSCCTLPAGLSTVSSWALTSRRSCEPIEATVFEDHDGAPITFREFFRGRPSIVVFFYTRCDNPLKCSLTVTKLGRIQRLLEARGLFEHIQTAAITYDPAFDFADRLRGYGQARGVRLDGRHRMLRAVAGATALCGHFGLGVNFIESLVNRHRIELYILDAQGRIAGSFERIHWDEHQVVERTIEVLNEENRETTRDTSAELHPPLVGSTASPMFGTLASLGLAVFPKCPVCWAAYLSMLGVAGLEQIPYAPWLQPVLFAAMLMNLAAIWLRARATGRLSGLYLASTGALAIVASKVTPGWEQAAVWGVALTLAGSLSSVLNGESGRLVWLRRLTTRAWPFRIATGRASTGRP